jgi:hypothetical protein
VRDPLLWLHVATGTAGLLTGPLWVAVRLRGRRGDGLAWAYLLAVAAVAVSGGVLAVTTPGLAWLLPVAVLTGGLAVAGALARRRAWPHWRTLQPHLLGGSYLALVTGALVASTGDPVWWVLPVLAGQVPIAAAKRRLHREAVVPPVAHLRRSTSAR